VDLIWHGFFVPLYSQTNSKRITIINCALVLLSSDSFLCAAMVKHGMKHAFKRYIA